MNLRCVVCTLHTEQSTYRVSHIISDSLYGSKLQFSGLIRNLRDFVEKKIKFKINVKIYLGDIQYDMGRTVVNI